MAAASADTAPKEARAALRWWRAHTSMGPPHRLALSYLLFVAGLVALRAVYKHDIDFLGMPWILALALVPLVPWLVPALSPWMGRLAPYVQTVKLGALEVQLRQSEPVVSSLGAVATSLTDPAIKPVHVAGQDDFYTTHGLDILNGMKALRERGAEVVTVDLDAGTKWRYPNLYFLTRLLEADPVVRHMVFTESRGGEAGYFVAMCAPQELHERFETAYPPYAEAGTRLSIPADMSAPGLDEVLKAQFDAFRDVLTQSEGRFAELQNWVTSDALVKLLGTAANRVTIEAKDALSDDDFRTVLLSPYRYAAVTSGGQFRSIIDQVPLAVAYARAAMTQGAATS
jgi:hypothetical protein